MKPILLILVSAIVYGCGKPERNTLFKLVSPEESKVDFVNQIDETDTFNILTYEYIYNGGGVGVADFNNDGFKDLFFAGNLVPNKLYINKGGLKFQDVTDAAGINEPGRWNSGVAIVDINNDGLMDVYVTATMRPEEELRRNMLFINQGISSEGVPTFKNEAGSYGIDETGYAEMAAFFDYDLDGDLDLYVLINQRMDHLPTNYRPKIEDGTALNNDKFFRNNGNNTFTDVTLEAGVTLEGFGLGLAVSDINLDGYPDVYVSNDYLSNDALLINNRNGTFTNRIVDYIGHQSLFSMGNDIADINNDARPDIITVDMLPETSARKKTTVGNKSYLTYIYNEKYSYEYQYVRNMVHLNNGAEMGVKFSEIGQLAGVHQTEWSWSPLFADVDNDGFKDLFVTNGFPKDITDKDFSNYRADVGNVAAAMHIKDSIPVINIPNYAFRNSGSLEFIDASNDWGLNTPSFSNGAAFADLDNDGDLDYVTNNINSPAFIFRNTLNDKPGANPWIDVRLEGAPSNKQAIGAKVTVFAGGKTQYSEVSLYRGYLSSVDAQLHFGLGSGVTVDSLLVQWPDLSRSIVVNPAVNQVLTINYSTHQPASSTAPVAPRQLFREVSSDLGIAYKHEEQDYIDFNLQRTLPHKFSQAGPGIAVGDINGDGIDDFVVGGSVGQSATVFTRQRGGKFTSRPLLAKATNKREEDEGLLLFDADGDGDQDLYLVGGGFEGDSVQLYSDRLYFNDGKGNYKLNESALPETRAAGSCVRAADFDKDGDLDLFVGGRVTPWAYPMPAESYILVNEGGKFTNKTADISPEVQKIGMITDALWSDFNGDNRLDLIVVGEFMPVTFFANDGQKLVKQTATGIENQSGWWYSLTGADFDNDGDIDYAAGNLGWNNPFQLEPDEVVVCLGKDFDANGSIDPILACYMRESMEDTVRVLYPVHFWDEMNQQSPKFRRKFSRYKQFSKATLATLLTPEETKGALELKANNMSTSYIENLGNGNFKMTAMPVEAQSAPVNGMITGDFNGDGNTDILMVGNDYGNEVFIGRYDAFIGLMLEGKGNGTFAPVPATKSGFVVDGDAKGLARLSGPDGDLYLATQNRGKLRVFANETKAGQAYRPAAGDVWAEVQFADGKRQKVEFYLGSGYLSQSGSYLRFPQNSTVVVHTADNQTKQLNNLK